MKAVVTESSEDAINRLVHPLQAHGALWQLSQLHHRQTGSLRTGRKGNREEMGGSRRQESMSYYGSKINHEQKFHH